MSVQSEVSRIEGLKIMLANCLASMEEANGTESLDALVRKAVTIMASYGDRISALEANSGGPAALAALLEINMSEPFYVQDESDAPGVISEALNINGFAQQIGTSGIRWKKPVVTVSEIEWSSIVDDNYNFTGAGTVQVSFGEAGVLTRDVTFKKPGEDKVYAVELNDNTARIETGIPADYAYRYHVKGHTIGGDMAVLADAYISNSARATARILGTSQKIQVQWPTNLEVLASTYGLDFQTMFEMTVGANYLEIKQGGRTVKPPLGTHNTSGDVGTDITLMGSTTGNYGNSILCFAEILDGSGNTIAYFEPYRIAGAEIVLLNTYGLTAQQIADIIQRGDGAEYGSRIYRPTVGILWEVTREEDEA